jgi:hypothetical protein
VSNFNDAAVNDVMDRIVSYAMQTGRFDQVNAHEPKSSPGTGMHCAVWMQSVQPTRSSGQSITSGVVVLNARIYTDFKSQPYDAIDPQVTGATCDMIGQLSGDFELGGSDDVRAVDLLGMAGVPLGAVAGYVEIDRTMFRVMTITIPIIINDMFEQVA